MASWVVSDGNFKRSCPIHGNCIQTWDPTQQPDSDQLATKQTGSGPKDPSALMKTPRFERNAQVHRCPSCINRRCHLPSFTFCWFIWDTPSIYQPTSDKRTAMLKWAQSSSCRHFKEQQTGRRHPQPRIDSSWWWTCIQQVTIKLNEKRSYQMRKFWEKQLQ